MGDLTSNFHLEGLLFNTTSHASDFCKKTDLSQNKVAFYLANSGKGGWGEREAVKELWAPLCGASCLPDHFSQRARKRPLSTQHFSGGWQKRNKNWWVNPGRSGRWVLHQALPSSVSPLVRMPELPCYCSCQALRQKLQAHSWSVWLHGDIWRKEGGISRHVTGQPCSGIWKIHHLSVLWQAKLLCQGQEIIYVVIHVM